MLSNDVYVLLYILHLILQMPGIAKTKYTTFLMTGAREILAAKLEYVCSTHWKEHAAGESDDMNSMDVRPLIQLEVVILTATRVVVSRIHVMFCLHMYYFVHTLIL